MGPTFGRFRAPAPPLLPASQLRSWKEISPEPLVSTALWYLLANSWISRLTRSHGNEAEKEKNKGGGGGKKSRRRTLLPCRRKLFI